MIGKLLLGAVAIVALPATAVGGYLALNLYSEVTPDNVSDRLNLLCSVIKVAVHSGQPVDCNCSVDVYMGELGQQQGAHLAEEVRAKLLVPRLHSLIAGDRRIRLDDEQKLVAVKLERATRQIEQKVRRTCRGGR